jgi:DNA-binding transcriptional LysR family regulator
MTLQQLTYFLAAATYGSFSAAADALHMAQPSLSEQVRRLEEELGVALFVRASHGLALTEAGAALRPHAEAVGTEVEAARTAVAERRELLTGTASFGMFGLPPPELVSDVVATFRARHPGVNIRLVGQNSLEVAGAVRDGDLEAGIVALPVDDTGLDVRRTIADPILYVSASAKRLRRRPTIRDVADAPLVLYDARYGSQDPQRRVLAERAQRAGLRVEAAIEVEDLYAALRIVAEGMGDTLVARKHVLTERFPEGIGAIALAEPMLEEYAVVTRRGAHLSPATRELLALTERRLEELHTALAGKPLPEPGR